LVENGLSLVNKRLQKGESKDGVSAAERDTSPQRKSFLLPPIKPHFSGEK